MFIHTRVGTLVNASAIIVGSSIGMFLWKNLPKKYETIYFQAVALFTLLLGLKMASGLGIGVLFSVVPLLLFQGGITLLVSVIGKDIPTEIISEITAVGGILLMGLSFHLLQIKEIKIINYFKAHSQ